VKVVWSIRRLMLVIAGVALILGVGVGLSRMHSPERCGRRTQCQSNLRNIVLAALAYANDQGHFPTGTWPNPNSPPEKRLSWYAATLPHVDCQELWIQVNLDRAWDDSSNATVANTVIGLLDCPQRVRPPVEVPTPTPYVGIAGLGTDAPFLPKGHLRAGVFGYDRQTSLKDLTDGAAYTMVVAESGRVRGSWLAGGPATVRGLDTADLPYLGRGRQFGGLHAQTSGALGANVAFADGSVRFISDTINPRVFEALSTIAGQEHLPPDLFDP
jgi:prepilin-type processing-associated H-X9-DG protein